MATHKEIAATLSYELKRDRKAEQFRHWAKAAVSDYVTKNPAHVPEGRKPDSFAEALELHDVKFDEDQVDKSNPYVVLSYTGPGIKFLMVNAIILNVEEGWAKNLVDFWSYKLASPRFKIQSVIMT